MTKINLSISDTYLTISKQITFSAKVMGTTDTYMEPTHNIPETVCRKEIIVKLAVTCEKCYVKKILIRKQYTKQIYPEM
jgi:hypothetical protein